MVDDVDEVLVTQPGVECVAHTTQAHDAIPEGKGAGRGRDQRQGGWPGEGRARPQCRVAPVVRGEEAAAAAQVSPVQPNQLHAAVPHAGTQRRSGAATMPHTRIYQEGAPNRKGGVALGLLVGRQRHSHPPPTHPPCLHVAGGVPSQGGHHAALPASGSSAGVSSATGCAPTGSASRLV